MTDRSRSEGGAQPHPGVYSYPAHPGAHPDQGAGEPVYEYPDSYSPAAAPTTPPPTAAFPSHAVAAPTRPLPVGAAHGPYGQPPPFPPGYVDGPPPEPPRRHDPMRWLWLLAALVVVVVVGLVAGLVISESSEQDTVVAPPPEPLLPSITSEPPSASRPPSPSALPPIPMPIFPPAPPDAATPPGTAHTVVYDVEGEGRVISILYLDTGGMLQTEFNVALPWRKQVRMTGSAEGTASVSVVNVGREITCSITIDGAPRQHNTGSGLTLCTTLGGR